MKNQILESVFAAMFFLIFLMFFEGMPKSTDTWVEYGIKSVAIAVIFLITEGIFSKKSLKKKHIKSIKYSIVLLLSTRWKKAHMCL